MANNWCQGWGFLWKSSPRAPLLESLVAMRTCQEGNVGHIFCILRTSFIPVGTDPMVIFVLIVENDCECRCACGFSRV